MKKSLKFISTALAAVMLAGTLAACGEKEEIPTITWYMPKSIDNTSSQELVEDEVNKVFEKEAGAKLKLVLVDAASYAEKMNVVINSGEEFDIMFVAPWMTATSYETNAPRGSFADITELLDKYGEDIKAKTDPRAWDYVTYDGKIQLVPSQWKRYQDVGWVFKKELVEKYNFDYKSVKEMKDLEPYFDTLLENEPDIVPVIDIVTPNWGYSTITSMGGGNLVLFDEAKEEFFFLLDDSRNLEDYRLRSEWYKKGYFPKDALTLSVEEEKKTGRYAVMKDTGAITEDGSKSSANYGFPCVDQEIENHAVVSADDFRTGNAISSTSQHPEEAMKILNIVWKDPYISNTLAYGIENIDYIVDEEKTAEIGEKSVIPKEGGDRTWTLWHNYIGPLFDQWDSSWNSKEALEEMEQKNQEATISKKADVQFDIAPIQTELAALTEIWEAATKVLQYGAMTDFDSYIGELREKSENAGVQKVIDELNRQYKAAKGE